MERGVGFIAWGQFDGPYNPPPPAKAWLAQCPESGYTWTPGWQPNLRIQWLDNTVTEPNTMANYNFHGYYDAFMMGYRFGAPVRGVPAQE